jgi:hypothetical protein
MYASFAPERLGASSPADGAHDSDAASSSAPTVHVPAQDAHAAFLIFAVAFVFNLNAALWTSQKHRVGLNVRVYLRRRRLDAPRDGQRRRLVRLRRGAVSVVVFGVFFAERRRGG